MIMRANVSAKTTLMETAVRSAKRASTITLSVKVIFHMTFIIATVVLKMMMVFHTHSFINSAGIPVV